MEKKTKTIIKEVFVASDGTEFNSEDDCIFYEEEKEQKNLVYPEVLCILDFPRGGDEHRLYKMSQLCRQFNAFVDGISMKVEDMMQEV